MKTHFENTPHGVAGQINTCVLDVDSDITGYGKHNRLLVFGVPGESQVLVREDTSGLRMSTEADRRKVINGRRRIHPARVNLKFDKSEEIESRLGKTVFHTYSYC